VPKYDLAVPGSFRLIPPEKRLQQLEKDYKDMQIMIFKDVPQWKNIIQILKLLEDEINNKGDSDSR
jgi:hypothetical protein